jgi:hypothetical protein
LIIFLPKQNKSNLASLLGLTCICIAISTFKESIPNPRFFTLLPTIGTALIIVFANNEILGGRVLSMRPLVWIGLTSYSSYLIHQPVFAFTGIRSLDPHLNELTYIWVILGILGVSYLTWRFVECPFRNRDTISIHSILFAILVFFIFIRVDAFSVLTQQGLRLDTQSAATKINLYEVTQTNQSLVSNKTVQVTNISTDYIERSVPNSELFLHGREKEMGTRCYRSHAFGPKSTKVELCPIGRDKTSKPVYFLFGDSLSMVMTGAFDELEYPGMFAALHGIHCSPLL